MGNQVNKWADQQKKADLQNPQNKINLKKNNTKTQKEKGEKEKVQNNNRDNQIMRKQQIKVKVKQQKPKSLLENNNQNKQINKVVANNSNNRIYDDQHNNNTNKFQDNKNIYQVYKKLQIPTSVPKSSNLSISQVFSQQKKLSQSHIPHKILNNNSQLIKQQQQFHSLIIQRQKPKKQIIQISSSQQSQMIPQKQQKQYKQNYNQQDYDQDQDSSYVYYSINEVKQENSLEEEYQDEEQSPSQLEEEGEEEEGDVNEMNQYEQQQHLQRQQQSQSRRNIIKNQMISQQLQQYQQQQKQNYQYNSHNNNHLINNHFINNKNNNQIRQKKRKFRRSKLKQQNLHIKKQYQQANLQQLNVFLFSQAKYNQKQITQQQQIINKFIQQLKNYGKIFNQTLLTQLDKKIKIKQILCPFNTHFQQQDIAFLDFLKLHYKQLTVNLTKNPLYNNQQSIQFYQQMSIPQYTIQYTHGVHNIGSSDTIINTRKYIAKSLNYKQKQFYQALYYLIQHKLITIQIQNIIFSNGQYQINYSHQQKNILSTLWSIHVSINFNLFKYYQHICLKNIVNNSYLDMIEQCKVIFDHLKSITGYLNKVKIDDKKFIVIQDIDLDYPQQFDGLIPKIKKKQKQINLKNLPDKQLTKKKLESLFESGKYFSLNSKIIKPSKPSKYFNGELKQFQALTLSWMLYREDCPIQYNYQTPQYNRNWNELKTIDKLYYNKLTFQILDYLPKWKKDVKGGILADEMGLGKTIMSLALIDKHVKRYKQNPQRQAGTLIVLPTGLISQWVSQIRYFLPHISYHVISTNKKVNKQKILSSTIILTSFQLLRNQRQMDRNYIEQDNENINLFNFEWFRLIVDQADNAKNLQTKLCSAINQINAKYKWLMTGTPIQNRISDLCSYLKILNFQSQIINRSAKNQFPSQKNIIAIKQTLKDILIRRKKDSVDQNGKKILEELKQYKWYTQHIKFNNQKDQQAYNNLCQGIIENIKQILDQDMQAGQWEQKMIKMNMNKKKTDQRIQQIFQKLIKLRQFCCHPKLIYSKSRFIKFQDFRKHYQRFFEDGIDSLALKGLKKKQKRQKKDFYKQIFRNLTQQKLNFYQRKQYVYQKIINKQKIKCSYCSQNILYGIVTICLHPYCQGCFKNHWRLNKKEQIKTIQNNKKQKRTYVQCIQCFNQIYHRQYLNFPRINRFNEEINKIQPNQKILKLINYIHDAIYKKQKVIVFTQFIGMIQIIMSVFKKNQIQALQMIGNDAISERQWKINQFNQNQQIKVFVISTKCGYAGLNLQVANKLFFMQPWWNPAIQDQALGRIHRMGQQKDVKAIRFLMEGSIQQSINVLGQKKKILYDFILDSDCSLKRKQKIGLLKELQLILQQTMSNYKKIKNPPKSSQNQLNYQLNQLNQLNQQNYHQNIQKEDQNQIQNNKNQQI